MRNYSKFRNRMRDSGILRLASAIYKEAGKQEMYLKQRLEKFNKLTEIIKMLSTEPSNAVEGIATTNV